MTALDQDALFAACRSLYLLAEQDFMLPPLMRDVSRDAGDADVPAGRVHKVRAGDKEIVFSVSLDSDYADRNVLMAPARLPLRFHAEMHDATGAGVELAARDQYELVRAFLLGAKLPLSVDLIGDGPRQRLSLQLAPRYSFDCGELIDPSTQPICKDICVLVSEAIFVRSHHFFADPQNGLAVWHLRAAQELFGDPRPAPETFWPIAEGEAAAQNPFIVPPAPQPARVKPRIRRYAIAASVLVGLLGPAVLLTGFGFRDEPSARAAIEEEPVTLSVAMQPQVQPQSAVKQAEPVVPEIPKAAEPVEERRIETASLAMASDAPRAILPVMMISPLSAIPPQLLQPAKAAPAPRLPVKPKAATKVPKMQVAAKRQDKNRFVNPLPSPQKVAAAITGAVKGIEKIPTRIAALVKPQTSAH